MSGRTSAQASISLSRNTRSLLKHVPNGEKYPPSAGSNSKPLYSLNSQPKRARKPAPKIKVPGRTLKAPKNEDLNRDPSSSSDSEVPMISKPLSSSPTRSPNPSSGNLTSGTSCEASGSTKRALRSGAKLIGGEPKSSQEYGSEGSVPGEKRKTNAAPELARKEDSGLEYDFPQMSSQSGRRHVTQYGGSSGQRSSQASTTTNLHARPAKIKAIVESEERTKKGLEGFKMPGQMEEAGAKSTFKAMQTRQDEVVPKRAGLSTPSFIDPTANIQETFGSRQQLSRHLIESDDISDLSSPPPDLEVDVTSSQIEVVSPPSPSIEPLTIPCPVCGETVATQLLTSFSEGYKLRYRDQERFCHFHQSQTAAEQWASHDYPTIDWSALSLRLDHFDAKITAILDLKKPSFYRANLEGKLSGSAKSRRAFHKHHVDAIPGYYGHRGAQVMMKHLMTRHRGKLKGLALTDDLIPMTGVAAYVQAVLVPELAVLLVKEDMGVGEGKARAILAESADLGVLVHPEEEEEVELQDDNDDDDDNDDVIEVENPHTPTSVEKACGNVEVVDLEEILSDVDD